MGRHSRLHPSILVEVAVSDWSDLCRRLLNDELDVVIAEISHVIDDERLVVEALPRQIEHEVALGRLVELRLKAPPAWLTSDYGIIRLARRTPSPA